MDTTDAPQIIEHHVKSLDFTPYVTKWIPGLAKFVLGGQTPSAKGILKIIKLTKDELKEISSIQEGEGIKCISFGASPFGDQHLAIGDFNGELRIKDLVKNEDVFKVQAHKKIINSLDAIGGLDKGFGAPEIVTGSRDGCVRLWDPRQQGPVLSLEPSGSEETTPDCWCVSFGNSFNDNERSIIAGYDNGDLKLFDLRKNSLIWDHNLLNGICGLQFDRKDTKMNKLVVTTLEGKVHIFDMRTHHFEQGYTSLEHKMKDGSTIWGVEHLPQNRDLFSILGGNGLLSLFKYKYPAKRVMKDAHGVDKGVVGNLVLLNDKGVGKQPIVSFDWHSEKCGLGVMSCLDQTCKVVICTKLGMY